MGRNPINKFTYEEVKGYIEGNSYCKLLSKNYFNSNEKIRLLCGCGNEFYTTFHKFKHENKTKCNECSEKSRKNKLSFSEDTIRDIFRNKGLTVLNGEKYVNSKTKLACEDNDGYRYSLTLDMVNRGDSYKRYHKSNPFTIFNISRFLTENDINCQIASDKYEGVRDFLDFRCACGNIFKTQWATMQQSGKRKIKCDECTKESVAQLTRLNIDYVKNILKEKGYYLIEGEVYKNAKTRISCTDKDGYMYYIKIGGLMSGFTPSRFCNGNIHTSYNISKFLKDNRVKAQMISNDVMLCNDPIDMICECGEKYKTSWAYLSQLKQTKCEQCRENIPHTIESAISIFKNNGYKLLDKTYKNNSTNMNCMDDEGYKYYACLANVKARNKLLRYTNTNPHTLYNLKHNLVLSKSNTIYVGGKFINVNEPVIFKCGKCGEIFKRSINVLVDRKSYFCKKCAREDVVENSRIGLEKAKEIVISRNLIPLFDVYLSNSQKLKCLTKEGYLVTPNLSSLQALKNPKIISPNNKYSLLNIQKYINNVSYGCIVLSKKYKGNNKKIKFRCACGNEFYRSWASMYSNKSFECEKCYIAKTSGIRRRCNSEVNTICNEYNLKWIDGEYLNNKSKLKVMDDSGYLYYLNVDDIKKYEVENHDIISKVNPYTIENIKRYLDINNISCELLSETWKGNSYPLIWRCECGNIFKRSWATFSNSVVKVCEKCSNIMSSYERMVEDELLELGVDYIWQKTFKDCKHVNKLRFDFYVPSKNILIECNGRQHYEAIDYFGGEKSYLIQKHRDQIKKEYCETQKINLLELPYYVFKDGTYKTILQDNINRNN